MTKYLPYIGVTGFMRQAEIVRALTVMGNTSRYLLMAGVLVSSKTLSGQSNRWPGRYPKIEDVKNIFVPHSRVLNIIHYNTDFPETLADQLDQLVEVGGRYLHGFQINLPWPDPEQLKLFQDRNRDRNRTFQIILQIGEDAIAQMDHDIGAIADRVRDQYASFVQYVLYDPSGGYGKDLDYVLAMQYLEIIARRGLNIQLVAAGGLHADNLSVVRYLAEDLADKKLPGGFELSIDAESKLRTTSGDGDTLDLDRMDAYLLEALHILEPAVYAAVMQQRKNEEVAKPC